MKTGKFSKNMMESMFLSSAAVMIATQIIGILAIIIDGVITGWKLGMEAYSAISLFHPFVTIVLMLAGFLSIGNQVTCSALVGEGKRKEANSVFSTSFAAGIVISALLLLLCWLKPDLLLRLFGVSVSSHPEYYAPMMDYLHGYMLSIPLLLIIQIIGPIIIMDNDRKLFTTSSTVLCAADIGFDLLNVLVFRGGVFGMGMATSLAYLIQAAILLGHFARKNAFFRLSLKGISLRNMLTVGRAGVPAFLQRLATALRNLFISRFNLSIALGVAAVAARGIQNDVNSLLFCISLGLGRAVLTLTGLNYGAGDRNGMRRLFSFTIKATLIISIATGAVIFLAAPLIVMIYTKDPEIAEYAIFGIRCMAVGLVFDAFATVYQDYLQGIRRRKLVNVLIFSERFFIPVLMALILGSAFGSKGVLASLSIGKFLLLIVVFIVVCIYGKKIPKNREDLMLLPEGFGGTAENNLYAHIETMEDVVRESLSVKDFCEKHGAEAAVSEHMALFLEELAGNVILHGKARGRREFGVDYRLQLDGETLTLTLRDLCEYFDPTTWYEYRNTEDPEKGLGIRIITGLAKEVRYFNAFNSNNIRVSLDLKRSKT